MTRRFTSGKFAIAECDICGFQYKLKELKKLTENDKPTGMMACPECWNAEHPQDDVGKYPVDDPQAVRDPRPDNSYYAEPGSRNIQWGWNPVGGSRGVIDDLTPNTLVAAGQVGNVVVTT